MKKWIVLLAMLCVFFAVSFCAQAEEVLAADAPELEVTEEYRWFVNKYKRTYTPKVKYYDGVYAYNHGDYVKTPFDSKVSPEYFVIDENGGYAVAPIVLDITDAMRIALYGEDVGETYMFYGQYSNYEKAVYQEKGKRGYHRYGFPGIHEGIDFVNYPNCPLYAILDGEVIRAGDADGTVAIYNEEYDCTVLYLHTVNISVKIGDVVEAGTKIALEGKKNSGTVYTHVELRNGREKVANTYRNSKLESDCPYPVMQKALNVVASGRQPVTAAAVQKAQEMREEAEAAARAEEEAEVEEAEPEIELVDTLPGVNEAYGFEQTTPAAPEATLPPSK